MRVDFPEGRGSFWETLRYASRATSHDAIAETVNNAMKLRVAFRRLAHRRALLAGRGRQLVGRRRHRCIICRGSPLCTSARDRQQPSTQVSSTVELYPLAHP